MSQSVKRVISLEMPENDNTAKKIKEEIEETSTEDVEYMAAEAAATATVAVEASAEAAAAIKTEPSEIELSDYKIELPANVTPQTITSITPGGAKEKDKQISSNVSTLATFTPLKLTSAKPLTVINTLNSNAPNAFKQSKLQRIVLLPKNTIIKNYNNPQISIINGVTKLPTQSNQTQNVTAPSITRLPIQFKTTQNVTAPSVTKLPIQFKTSQNVTAPSVTKLPIQFKTSQNVTAPSVTKLSNQFKTTQNVTKIPTQFNQTQNVIAPISGSVTTPGQFNQTQNVTASISGSVATQGQFNQNQNGTPPNLTTPPTQFNQTQNLIAPISGSVMAPASTPTTQLSPQIVEQQQQTWNLNVDEICAQKTDSDEDGYSVIDFYDDDFRTFDSATEFVDEFDPLWKPSLLNNCKVFDYTGGLQHTLRVSRPYEPIAYFDLLLGSRLDFFTKLANSCSARGSKNCSKFKSFTAEELQIFMGICLQMSTLRLHRLKQYWDKNANFGFNGFEDKMSLKLFESILNVLNFNMFESNGFEDKLTLSPENDRNEYQLYDKFADLKPLFNYYNWRMGTVYNCDRNLILNDPLIYWKGKFNWINEVNTKFRYNAVILHWLSEPSGLVLRIVIDSEDIDRKYVPRNSKSVALTRFAAALEVLKPKLDKGRIVYASKYYSSYALALLLAKRKTYCNGLLEPDRFGNSKELILTPLDKGDVIARYADDIMMGKYRKNQKNVYFYSSNCQAVFANERQNIQSSLKNVVKEIKSYLRPPTDIRAHILNCQLLLPIQEIKWDKRIMIYVMNLLVLNAYILYTTHKHFYNGESPMRYEKFRQEVITSLFNTPLENKHIIQIIPLLCGKIVKKKCQICYKSGLNTYTKYFCKICPGSPGLCVKPCFRIWHDALQKSTYETKAAGV